MSRTLARLSGGGAAGIFIDGDYFKLTPHVQPLKHDLDMLMLHMQRNVYAGGSDTVGLDASATGDFDLLNWLPIESDNSNSQLSGFTDANGATFVHQWRFLLRMSNSAINVTPKLWYGSTITTITTVASITGQAACSATNSDYSGTNQYQTVAVTLPAGVKLWKAGGTIAGTPAAGYQWWGRAIHDVYVQST